MNDPHRIGLRFDRGDHRRLKAMAQQLREADNLNDTVGLFDKAADAAQTGEPLILVCDHPDEATATAEAFVLYGCNRPAIEALAA